MLRDCLLNRLPNRYYFIILIGKNFKEKNEKKNGLCSIFCISKLIENIIFDPLIFPVAKYF